MAITMIVPETRKNTNISSATSLKNLSISAGSLTSCDRATRLAGNNGRWKEVEN